ncbi:MAG TPA: HU family DNA-binding protein, partial [Myxococcota bacterium]|nr:HU family DNA-binding protein [Myxococcota bacterium]
MNWTSLIEQVSERTGRPAPEVKEILESMVEVCIEALAEGEDLTLRGLGAVGSRWLEPRSLRSVHDSRRL